MKAPADWVSGFGSLPGPWLSSHCVPSYGVATHTRSKKSHQFSMPASHVGTGGHPGCSTSEPVPANMPGKQRWMA